VATDVSHLVAVITYLLGTLRDEAERQAATELQARGAARAGRLCGRAPPAAQALR
jgi:hypothetical protein